jgi:hypothetical protein
MDRVKGVNPDQADETAKTLFQTLRKEIGLVPRSKLLAAYDNPTLMASTRMDGVTAKAKTVPASLKELAQLKVAVMVGCPF